ncbi:MAG TPA: hypothetical protein VKA70_18950 [Blastocatellia bacterium]|nr:hypothetical protein [Blastocatellia bacterium]
MNCQEFEASINDLARDQIMDVASRTSAHAHSEGCAECAARLADERMLSAGLRYLAASASDEQAPARVEDALLAALRERKANVAAPAVTLVARRRMSRWAIAAAAAILILIALVALRANQSRPEPPQHANQAQPAPAPAPIGPEKKSPERENSVAPASPRREAQNHFVANRPRRPSPRAEAVNAKDNAKDKDSAAGDYEITTDFIPLTHRGSLAELEGGQVLRVELPRSSLASFGLPMNLERAGERIKADVVVGNDGMARAIRFVR